MVMSTIGLQFSGGHGSDLDKRAWMTIKNWPDLFLPPGLKEEDPMPVLRAVVSDRDGIIHEPVLVRSTDGQA